MVFVGPPCALSVPSRHANVGSRTYDARAVELDAAQRADRARADPSARARTCAVGPPARARSSVAVMPPTLRARHVTSPTSSTMRSMAIARRQPEHRCSPRSAHGAPDEGAARSWRKCSVSRISAKQCQQNPRLSQQNFHIKVTATAVRAAAQRAVAGQTSEVRI